MYFCIFSHVPWTAVMYTILILEKIQTKRSRLLIHPAGDVPWTALMYTILNGHTFQWTFLSLCHYCFSEYIQWFAEQAVFSVSFWKPDRNTNCCLVSASTRFSGPTLGSSRYSKMAFCSFVWLWYNMRAALPGKAENS